MSRTRSVKAFVKMHWRCEEQWINITAFCQSHCKEDFMLNPEPTDLGELVCPDARGPQSFRPALDARKLRRYNWSWKRPKHETESESSTPGRSQREGGHLDRGVGLRQGMWRYCESSDERTFATDIAFAFTKDHSRRQQSICLS